MDKMGDGFTVEIVECFMQSAEGVRTLRAAEDPQPAFDWVEEGEVWPEGGDISDEREEIVETVDALVDMSLVV